MPAGAPSSEAQDGRPARGQRHGLVAGAVSPRPRSRGRRGRSPARVPRRSCAGRRGPRACPAPAVRQPCRHRSERRDADLSLRCGAAYGRPVGSEEVHRHGPRQPARPRVARPLVLRPGGRRGGGRAHPGRPRARRASGGGGPERRRGLVVPGQRADRPAPAARQPPRRPDGRRRRDVADRRTHGLLGLAGRLHRRHRAQRRVGGALRGAARVVALRPPEDEARPAAHRAVRGRRDPAGAGVAGLPRDRAARQRAADLGRPGRGRRHRHRAARCC